MDWITGLSVEELHVAADEFCAVSTEEDPDGSDRGGFHQAEHHLTVEGKKLSYELKLSDYYQERFSTPEPAVEDKEDAIEWLKHHRNHLQNMVKEVDKLISKVKKTTSFSSTVPEPGESDDVAED